MAHPSPARLVLEVAPALGSSRWILFWIRWLYVVLLGVGEEEDGRVEEGWNGGKHLFLPFVSLLLTTVLLLYFLQ